MKKLPLKKLNSADTSEGVKINVLNAGFVPFEEDCGITLMTVFKGKERHTRPRRKKDNTVVILQSYTKVEGAEDKVFIALSADGTGSKKRRKHLYCKVYFK